MYVLKLDSFSFRLIESESTIIECVLSLLFDNNFALINLLNRIKSREL